jgi:hypothetical protein
MSNKVIHIKCDFMMVAPGPFGSSQCFATKMDAKSLDALREARASEEPVHIKVTDRTGDFVGPVAYVTNIKTAENVAVFTTAYGSAVEFLRANEG